MAWPAVLAELIPITSPLLFNNAPPLLPGLIAASVWIKLDADALSPSSDFPWTERPKAETTPVVTDCPYPRALPIAIVGSPTLNFLESPNFANLIFL